MPGDGAVMNISGKVLPRNRLDARDLALDRLDVEILDLALRLRCVLLLGDMRKAAGEVLHQFRELLEVHAATALRYAGEAGHALRHVGLEADPLLLAVIADIDAGRRLLVDDMAHGLVHLGRHLRLCRRPRRPRAGSAGRRACRCAAGCRHGSSGCGRGWSAWVILSRDSLLRSDVARPGAAAKKRAMPAD